MAVVKYTPSEFKFSKDPDEQYYIRMNFSSKLRSGETLTGAYTLTGRDKFGTDVSTTILTDGVTSFGSTYVDVWVKAGTDGQTYFVRMEADTSSGTGVMVMVIQMDVVLKGIGT